MTRKWSNVTGAISMAIALLGCAAVVPADAQTLSIPPRLTFAYTDYLWGFPCLGGGGCNAGGTEVIIGTFVVTPFGQTPGPWDSDPTWSPDATKIAYVSSSADISVAEVRGGTLTNITTIVSGGSPKWSPDGRRLAFASAPDGQIGVYLMNVDGSNIVRLAPQVGFSPTWSPDSTRIAFTCILETSNRDICVINSDGTGLFRLTNEPGSDDEPAWSPDGRKITFATTRYGGTQLALMNTDGSGVSSLGGIQGSHPAWLPDGRRMTFTASVDNETYVMNADGSDVRWLWYDFRPPVWMPGSLFARFSTECSALVCRFDASSSVGNLTSFRWDFGDTTSASGLVASHTFSEGGTYTISLVVTDANGVSAKDELALTLNRPPNASFTASCNGLQCTFDGSGSSDSDGTIVDFLWMFGDGSTAEFGGNAGGVGDSGRKVTHVYPATSTYNVVLTIRDDSGATSNYSLNVTLSGAHIGDLDVAGSPGRSSWTASVTVLVHDDVHRSVANAIITGSWSGLSGAPTSCRTADNGVCTITSDVPNSINSTTFNVLSVVAGTAYYDAARNHDVDGGTNGTTVTVRRR